MIERDLAELDGLEVVEYVLDFDEVEIFGDRAVECGIYRATYRSREDGTTVQGSGRLMRVLERQQDGTWPITRAIWNEDGATHSVAEKAEPSAQPGDASNNASRRSQPPALR